MKSSKILSNGGALSNWVNGKLTLYFSGEAITQMNIH